MARLIVMGMLEGLFSIVGGPLLVGLLLWWIQGRVKLRPSRSPIDHPDIEIHRVSERDHEAAEGIIDLYVRHFEADGTNYTPDELLDFLTSPISTDRHLPVENIILAAKTKSTVVGFIFCHFYPTRRKAIVSYYCIDKRTDVARKAAAKALAQELFRLLTDKSRPCQYLFFDTQNPEVGLTKRENRERLARPALFKLTAQVLGLKAYRFEFDYQCPRVSMDPETREYPFTLLCTPLDGSKFRSTVRRGLLLKFIEFVYLDCYGDVYPKNDPRFRSHRTYLEGQVAKYALTLPGYVIVS